MKHSSPKLKVAISQLHNGQIVYPVATARPAGGPGRITVELYWYDRSDGEHLRPASFTGHCRDAENWLIRQGVHLDAQGIYGWEPAQ